eukprot:GHVH01008172.1.p1 GENE.GHVH01008172.1~~GHVH01008172.1.p1  ORF type:complete len:163 (+),score=28.40 GHVH01008172.1:68-556(+)
MPSHMRKTRKLRGHVSHGHGRVGKHRKHPGGRGNAGSITHHRIGYRKYHPLYIGKFGTTDYHRNQCHLVNFCPEISVGKVTSVATFQEREAARKSGVINIDLVKSGYFKVVAGGDIPSGVKVNVTARYITDEAKLAIEASGGSFTQAITPVFRKPTKDNTKK